MLFSLETRHRSMTSTVAAVMITAMVSTLWVVAADADTGTLLVANKSDDTLSVISASDGLEVARIDTGRSPHEVEVDPRGTLAVVANYGTDDEPGSSLTFIDLKTHGVSSLDLDPHTRPHGLAWLPDARHLLVTTEGSQSLVLVDVETMSVLAAIPTQGKKPHMVVVDPTGRWAWTANVDSGTVSRVDVAARKVVATAPAGEGVEGVALASDGRLWTAANGDGKVRILDAITLETIATIDVGGMPIRVELAERHDLALITSATTGRITAIDMKSFEVRRMVSTRWHSKIRSGRFLGGFFGVLPVPVGAQLSQKGDSFYVANSFGGLVVEFSLPNLEMLREIEAGHEPDGMTVTSYSGKN